MKSFMDGSNKKLRRFDSTIILLVPYIITQTSQTKYLQSKMEQNEFIDQMIFHEIALVCSGAP